MKAEWTGRHYREVPRHHYAKIVANIDLDVVVGRKPGIPQHLLGSPGPRCIRGVLQLGEEDA
jgi:hypothetical protein